MNRIEIDCFKFIQDNIQKKVPHWAPFATFLFIFQSFFT